MDSLEEEHINNIKRKVCGVSINRQMIPSKIAIFCLYSSIACFLFFRNIFLVSVGLTASEAGFISGMCYVGAAITGPICGALSDYTGYRKLIFVTLCVCAGLSTFSLPWVAMEVAPRTSMNQTMFNNTSNANMPDNVNDKKINATTSDVEYYKHTLPPFANTLFYYMLVLSVVSFSLFTPLYGLVDSIVTNIIDNTNTKGTYGKQRMFGSVASGLSTLIAGTVNDSFYHPNMSKYSPSFFISMPLVLLLVPLAHVLFKQTNWEIQEDGEANSGASTNAPQSENKRSRIKLLLVLLKNIDNAVIMISVLIAGLFRNVTFALLFLIMKDDMGASATTMGVTQLVNYLADFFMFPFTKQIIKAVGGPVICIEIGILAWVIRILALSYIENAWLVILPQILQCFSFALFWAAIVEYTQQISSKEIYMTMFQLIYSLHFFVSGVVGNMVGGTLYQYYKGPAVFRCSSAIGGAWLFVLFTYFHGIPFVKGKVKRVLVVEPFP